MVNVYKGKLDIKSTSSKFAPVFVQYDKGRLEIELLDGGEPYDLSTINRVEFTHVRKDSTVIIEPGEIVGRIEGNVLCYDYRGSEMDVLGKIKTSLAIFDTENNKVSSHVFEVTVTEDLRNEVFNPAEPHVGVLEQLLAEVQYVKDNPGPPGPPGPPGTGSGVELENSLTSDSVTKAVTAAKAKELNEKIAALSAELQSKLSVYVTDFGAIGDGETDNTAAFQAAFDYCYTNNTECLIPDGRFIINGTLTLPPILTIKGTNVTNSFGDWHLSNCILGINNMVGFIGRTVGGDSLIKLNCSGVFFRAGTYSANSILFKDINFYHCDIYKNVAFGFGTIAQGSMHQLTTFRNNTMAGISKSFFVQSRYNDTEPAITDSYVKDNYISGDNAFNPVFFDVDTMAHSYIQDNFMDFAKIVFKFGIGGCGGSIFSGNIFDMTFRVFTGDYSKSKIVNNQFTHISSTYTWFTNPDQEMLNGEWTCFTAISQPFHDLHEVLISGNQTYMTQNFVIFLTPVANTMRFRMIKIANNIYDEAIVKRVDYQTCAEGAQSIDIHIEDLMYIEVTTLPNPAITGIPIATSFAGQIVKYQNKFIYNDNGQWRDYMGNVITAG